MAAAASTITALLSFNSHRQRQILTNHGTRPLAYHYKPSILTFRSTPNPRFCHKDQTFFTLIARSGGKDGTFIAKAADYNQKDSTMLTRIAQGAAFLLASTVFFAVANRRPALALDDSLKGNSSAPLEEKIDAGEKIEEVEEEDDEDETEMYVRIVENNPSDLESLKAVVYGKMKKGKVEEALEYVDKLIAAEPDEVEWRLLQALSYELMGKLDMAKTLFKEILKERPLLIRALHGLALAMLRNREGFAAFRMLNKALDLAHRENRVTEERNIKILIAQMYMVGGDLEGASKRFQELTYENPRDFRPYLCQGIIYSLMEKNKEADEQFELYRSLVPDEFPQRKFIDDAILTAKMEYQEQMKELNPEGSYTK